jgi:hypothetical protein
MDFLSQVTVVTNPLIFLNIFIAIVIISELPKQNDTSHFMAIVHVKILEINFSKNYCGNIYYYKFQINS